MGEPAPSVRFRYVASGLGKGLLLGILFGVIATWIVNALNMSIELRRAVFVEVPLVSMIIGAVIGLILYQLECRFGFLRIDDEQAIWRTSAGFLRIPLEKVFGAGPETAKSGKCLRICALADNRRGFRFYFKNFENYLPVSGPITWINRDGRDGNDLAREAFILHIRERLKSSKPVADLPAYGSESSMDYRMFTMGQDFRISGRFSCDGSTLHFRKDTEYRISGAFDSALNTEVPEQYREDLDLEIPVRTVQDFYVLKGPGNTLGSAYIARLKFDPSSGHKDIQFDLGYCKDAKEIEMYLQCLPFLFPSYSDTEFWLVEF
jgi:uncharacterized membrane protein YeaQ/YmgE (transglycosylase-associated protein family)